MNEVKGRIDVSKDSMLYVANEIFSCGIKSSTTKEKILEYVPRMYEEGKAEDIIKMLPYKEYKTLKKIIEDMDRIEDENNINEYLKSIEHNAIHYLMEAMIIVLRASSIKHTFSVDKKVLETLKKIYTKENEKLAEKYEKIEKLTIGMLYTYGVVEFEYYRKMVCKCFGEVISDDEIEKFLFIRLNLNNMIDYLKINWINDNSNQIFITYLLEEYYGVDPYQIAVEQKNRNLDYKKYNMNELINREEYLRDENTRKFVDYLLKMKESLRDCGIDYLLKKNEYGQDVLDDLASLLRFKYFEELQEFTEKYIEWYQNSPQYVLCGYSPKEMSEKFAPTVPQW